MLSSEQWLTASQLERSGWLRFDAYSSVWSVHPLVKAVCASEKGVQPDWETVGSFVAALQKNQKAGFYEDAGIDGKRQIEELFANIGRCSLRRPFPWKKICAAVLIIAAVITGFWYSGREIDDSPVLTLVLSPDKEASAEEISHDSELLQTRLKELGIQDVSVNTESGTVTAHTHTSVFGQVEDLSDAINLTINLPGHFYVIGKKAIPMPPIRSTVILFVWQKPVSEISRRSGPWTGIRPG